MDNIIGYYLNGKQVPVKIWEIEMAKDESLRNSNFGQKPLHGMRNLTTREASRFLEMKRPSTLPEVAEPSAPPVGKMAKGISIPTHKNRKARRR
ncbi:MAG: hypothetical protein LBE98_01340 [Puniceicoccales bacterium]|nr:hypothetical protein [Puniceicoccales bacterium]